MKLVQYYENWVETYKKGAVRDVTLRKYKMDIVHLRNIAPGLECEELTRPEYQKIINVFAETHEKITVLDFHHRLKAAVMDAVDDGLVPADPTRRVVVKGKQPSEKKIKYLNRFELESMLRKLELGDTPSYEWLILLVAKTGMRFSEALAITPADFDFKKQTLSITKTWDYKNGGGFAPTKNASSVRKIKIDWQTAMQFSQMCTGLPQDAPIFVKEGINVYNSTVNDILARKCEEADVPVIAIHGLRHTHASILLSAGVSIASVAQRLGHSNMTTTQKVYLHIIKELEDKDTGMIMSTLTGLGG